MGHRMVIRKLGSRGACRPGGALIYLGEGLRGEPALDECFHLREALSLPRHAAPHQPRRRRVEQK
eukprot:5151274-Pyramimonas_sp.AAC.2